VRRYVSNDVVIGTHRWLWSARVVAFWHSIFMPPWEVIFIDRVSE
jgi:hypothetical protein